MSTLIGIGLTTLAVIIFTLKLTDSFHNNLTTFSEYEIILKTFENTSNTSNSRILKKRMTQFGGNWCRLAYIAATTKKISEFYHTNSCCKQHAICGSQKNHEKLQPKPKPQTIKHPTHKNLTTTTKASNPTTTIVTSTWRTNHPSPNQRSTTEFSTLTTSNSNNKFVWGNTGVEAPKLEQTSLSPMLNPVNTISTLTTLEYISTTVSNPSQSPPTSSPQPAISDLGIEQDLFSVVSSTISTPEQAEFEQLHEQEQHAEEKYDLTHSEEMNGMANQLGPTRQPFKLTDQSFDRRRRFLSSLFPARSWCDCDRQFYTCLKKVKSTISWAVGKSYFNFRHPLCQTRDHPIIGCKKYQRTFYLWKCVEYHVDTTKNMRLQVRDNPSF